MIPKKIHYCWFGGNPLPDLAIKCIESWRRFFPDYEIIEWNESNFNVKANDYIYEAYKLKKYAFVSDFARFYILYHYGGLYFDTDVEIIKSMDDIIERGAFMGLQSPKEKESKNIYWVGPGLGLGANSGLSLYKYILDYYECHHFVNLSGELSPTVVKITSDIIKKLNCEYINDEILFVNNEVYIYPEDYFCPLNYWTGKLEITHNTISIHHYSASWLNKSKPNIFRRKTEKFKRRCIYILSVTKILKFI